MEQPQAYFSCGRSLLGIALLFFAVPSTADVLPCQFVQDNTCLFNTTFHSVPGKGDLVLDAQNHGIVRITAEFTSPESLTLSMNGDCLIDPKAKLSAAKDVSISTEGTNSTQGIIQVNSAEIQSGNDISLKASGANPQVNISGSSVGATRNVDIESSGKIFVQEAEAVVTSSKGNVTLSGGKGVQIWNNASIAAPTWKDKSAGFVTIQTSCEGPLTTTTGPSTTTTVTATEVTKSTSAGAQDTSATGATHSLRFLHDSLPTQTDESLAEFDEGIVKAVVREDAKILAGSQLEVIAWNILIGSGATLTTTDGDLILGSSSCGGGITISDTVNPDVDPSLGSVESWDSSDTDPSPIGTLQGVNVHLISSKESLMVKEGFIITASKSIVLQNDGGPVHLCSNTPHMMVTPMLQIRAGGDAIIAADIQGVGAENLWSLEVRSAGLVQLAPASNTLGQWTLDSALIYGRNVSVQVKEIFLKGANTCDNNGTKGDLCKVLLNNPTLLNYYSDGKLLRPHSDFDGMMLVDEPDVKFDFLVVATSDINLLAIELRAASVMLCSNENITMNGTKLDVSGRGCPAGKGPGAGGIPMKDPDQIGAGGGSHVARGGQGCRLNGKRAELHCEIDPGIADQPEEGFVSKTSVLPTAGASGGGCTGKHRASGAAQGQSLPDLCSGHPTLSAGGGMIWVSAGQTLEFEDSVNLKASGLHGGPVSVDPAHNTSNTAGGGSGGQILLFAGQLEVSEQEGSSVVFEANGGDIGCNYQPKEGTGQIGGAGGGGFIGLQELRDFGGNASRTQLSVYGGNYNTECDSISVPKDGFAMSLGKDGVKTQMGGCAPGYEPPLCTPCGIGMWGDGTMNCSQCTNGPHVAVYPYGSNPNKTCRYECPVSYPSVDSNNKDCYSPLRYYMRFYGGIVGFCCLFSVLGLLLLLLFCRGRKWCSCSPPDASVSSTDLHMTRLGQMKEWLWDSLLTVALGSRFGRGVTKSSEFHFPKEHLPSHRFRLYFHGENRAGNRWCLDRKLPEMAEPLVTEAQWQDFVGRVHNLTEVSRFSRSVEVFLQYCYPPLAPIVARRFRIGRARRIQTLARQTSDCEDMRADFWRPIRARTCQREEGLGMVFGCDAGASLGYLDFFDYSISAIDYTVELVSQAFILPTHGFGTWDDPFEIDCGDPLVAHITATALGPWAVSRAVFDFNRASRVMWRHEVNSESHVRGIMEKRIKRCIDRVDELRGVLAVMNIEEEYEEPESRTILDSLLSPAGQGGGSPSFADLAERPVSRALSESSNRSNRQLSHTFRASLVFGNTISLLQTRRGDSDFSNQSGPTYVTATVAGPVVSPLPAPHLRDQTSRRSFADQGQVMSAPPSRWKDACLRALSFPIPKCLSWTTGSETIMMLLVILAFCDLLAYLVFVYMFAWIIQERTVWYILLPFPLLEPASFILGAAFVLAEYPVLGRVYASFVIFSLVPLAVEHFVLLIDSQPSRTFWILQWCLRGLIKFCIFSLTNFHVYTLLSRWDLNYLKSPNWDADDLLADPSRRMYASPSAASSFVPANSSFPARTSNSNMGHLSAGTFSSHPGAMISMGSTTSTYGGEAFQITQAQRGSRSPRSAALVWSGLPRMEESNMATESMRPRRSSRVDTRTPSPSRRRYEGSPF